MKKQLLAFGFLLATLAMQSQENIFNVGDKDINFGLGLGSTIGYTVSGTKIPPVFLRGDYGFKEGIGPGIIGIGGIIGIERYGWSDIDDSWSYSRFIIGASGTYHYAFVDKLDTYGGISLGFRTTTSKHNYPSMPEYNSTHVYPGLFTAFFVGARYYFTENIGVMGEVGYDLTYLKLGLAIKL